MYVVRNTDGDIIAIASRREDAAAMAQTVGKESKKIVEKN
jgi:hypothetical protein